MPQYWLMKSEPDEASIDDLANAPGQRLPWTGVRNYQARNFMRDRMKVGDGVLFYHSSCPQPGIAGVVRVVRTGFPDASAFDAKSEYYDPKGSRDEPRWFSADVQFEKEFEPLITLVELREHAAGALRDMLLLKRGNRLSITPVTAAEWRFVNALRR
jgi:predicted RNA-binding protein with PUA-like domain